MSNDLYLCRVGYDHLGHQGCEQIIEGPGIGRHFKDDDIRETEMLPGPLVEAPCVHLPGRENDGLGRIDRPNDQIAFVDIQCHITPTGIRHEILAFGVKRERSPEAMGQVVLGKQVLQSPIRAWRRFAISCEPCGWAAPNKITGSALRALPDAQPGRPNATCPSNVSTRFTPKAEHSGWPVPSQGDPLTVARYLHDNKIEIDNLSSQKLSQGFAPSIVHNRILLAC